MRATLPTLNVPRASFVTVEATITTPENNMIYLESLRRRVLDYALSDPLNRNLRQYSCYNPPYSAL